MGVVLVLGGGALIWFGRYTYRQRQTQLAAARQKLGWPTVAGTITANGLDEHEHESTQSDGSTETTTQYAPRLAYVYHAHGQEWTGTRIHVLEDAPYATRRAAQAVCDRYPLGSRVSVHVGPTPEDGVYLDGHISEGWERAMAVALAVLLAGGGLVMVGGGIALMLAGGE